MQRLQLSIVTGLLCCFALAACSENPNDVKRLNGARGTVVTSSLTLDQSIQQLLALFPRNLDQRDPDFEGPDLNPRATWDQIKKKYATGLSKPAHMEIAKRKLVRLSDWVARNAQMMSPPPNLETKTAASARLVLYMNMYVYGGPGGTPPDFIPGADVAVGVVTPDAPATIVTPTKHAGVQFEAGSVAENTVVVVIQNPNVFSANCSGPLDTRLCQYPQFYTFDQFPHKTLLKPAKFNVCHVTGEGGARNPGGIHDRLRLAHTKPALSTDYTPGSAIRDNIEILPLVPQTFSTCEASSYETEIGFGDTGLMSRLAKGIQKIVSPKNAYAIDLGLGGLSKSFSAFNDVDSIGRPDLAVQSVSVTPGVAHPGEHLTLSYSVTNIGTATRAPIAAIIYLTPPPPVVTEGPPQTPVDQQLATITLPALAPGSSNTRTDVDLTIPPWLVSGTYQVKLVVGSDPTFADASTANNTASTAVGLDASIIVLGTLPGDDGSVGTAINDAGHAVGASGGGFGGGLLVRPMLWIDGVMTSLGSLGGSYGQANGINNSEEIAGYSRLATGENRAFRWKNGTMLNLGTLPETNASVAVGINSSGQIAGYSYRTSDRDSSRARSWIWENGVMAELAISPSLTAAVATGINDHGQVVGWGYTESGIRAWAWQDGEMTILSAPEGLSWARAINGNGVVAGSAWPIGAPHERPMMFADGVHDLGLLNGDLYGAAYDISNDGRIVGLSGGGGADGGGHPVLWQNGAIINLGTLGGYYTQALGINENGLIVGWSSSPGSGFATIWRAPPLD